jgi:hypothetical protein
MKVKVTNDLADPVGTVIATIYPAAWASQKQHPFLRRSRICCGSASHFPKMSTFCPVYLLLNLTDIISVSITREGSDLSFHG